MLKTISTLFYYELLLNLRRSQDWLYPLCFFMLVIFLFPLGVTIDNLLLQTFIPGCIWIATLLANLLAMQHFFSTDLEEGIIEQWLLCPISVTVLIYIKLAAQWLLIALPIILLTPLLGLLFHLEQIVIFTLCISLLIGTPILTLIAGLGAAFTLELRQSGMLLSLLILPLVIPVLIFAMSMVQQAQAGISMMGPLSFLIGLCFLTLTFIPFCIAKVLQISLDD